MYWRRLFHIALLILILVFVGALFAGSAPQEKTYTQEQIKKMFPVPKEWEEWYKLQKQGKLPGYLTIYDKSEKWQQNVANELLFQKRTHGEMKKIGMKYFQNRMYISMGSLAQYFLDRSFYTPMTVELMLDYLERPKFYTSEPPPKYIRTLYWVTESLRKSFLRCHSHPLFFKEKMEEIRKHKQRFWKIYNNAEEIALEKEYFRVVRGIGYHALYFLGEDLDFLIKESIRIKGYHIPFSQPLRMLDPVNRKVIYYTDIKIKPLMEWRIKNRPLSKLPNDLIYFFNIGEQEKYVDLVIEFCRTNLNSWGLSLFQELLLEEFYGYKSDAG